jgi:DNA-binding response OmpR family regulator
MIITLSGELMTKALHEGGGDDPFFRILCVHDDPALQAALKTGVENYGLEVVTASPGFDAMMQFKTRQGRFGAIIIGHASKTNDSEFARSVRDLGYRGRIIVMANRLTKEELHAYEPHAISGFFSRPFDPSTLAAMLLQAD